MAEQLNFLWRANDGRPIYVMDNHLGALWCWLRELRPEDEYSLLHIDYHWDDAAEVDPERIRAAEIRSAPGSLALQELLALKTRIVSHVHQLVRWDNYIQPLPGVRPLAREAYSFVHESNEGNGPLSFALAERHTSIESLGRVPDLIPYMPGRLLVNLDFDYFFVRLGDTQMRVFSDEFLSALVRSIDDAARAAKKDTIWTIAWSPECCGGWRHSAEACKVVCGTLGLTCPAAEMGF
jgi:hypothetical protein